MGQPALRPALANFFVLNNTEAGVQQGALPEIKNAENHDRTLFGARVRADRAVFTSASVSACRSAA